MRISLSTLPAPAPAKQLKNLVSEAIVQSASVIHVEPRGSEVTIRLRVDGGLRTADSLPIRTFASFVAYLRLQTKLIEDHYHQPQEGTCSLTIDKQRYDLRISFLPTTEGEKVVIHIISAAASVLSLSQLGLWGEARQAVETALTEPHGLVVISGPIGAGKSTTLFSLAHQLNTPKKSIATVEDPVEYRLGGANQVRVNPDVGLSMVRGLRAILKQDPSVIVISDIRDSETAQLAAEASQGSHLVLAGLPTLLAADAVAHLQHFGVQSFVIASSLRLSINQRLVRRLCLKCREHYKPDAAELKRLVKHFELHGPSAFRQLHDLETQAQAEGLSSDTKQHSTTATHITKLWRASSSGCAACGHSGYRGRIGLFEVIPNSPEQQRLIVGQATAQARHTQAVKEGIVSLQLDGLVKVLCGLTDSEAILHLPSA